MLRPAVVLSLVASVLVASAMFLASAQAGKVKTWQTNAPANYDKAKFKDAVISNQGVVRLSKLLKPLAKIDAAHVWDVTEDAAGNLVAAKVLEQTAVMRDQVAHHLERARIAARLTVIGTVTEVAPAIEALRRTMEKIHRDRNILIKVEADSRAKFRGERQDLEEMAGNLVDNACKWASSHVFVEVRVEPPTKAGAGPLLRIVVDDDGRGLSAAELAQVSRRGQRLDESKPGSGLGLSIVVDLAALYGGSLVLGTAPIGGLRA